MKRSHRKAEAESLAPRKMCDKHDQTDRHFLDLELASHNGHDFELSGGEIVACMRKITRANSPPARERKQSEDTEKEAQETSLGSNQKPWPKSAVFFLRGVQVPMVAVHRICEKA